MLRPRQTPSRRETPSRFGATPDKLERSLRELALANRLFGGSRSVGAAAQALVGHLEKVRLLDVGTGGGDIPRALVERRARRGLATEVIALDRHPLAIARAARSTAGDPRIAYVLGDAGALPFADASFDLTMSSMLLHYFDSTAARGTLAELSRVAARGVIVADIERHWLPCACIEWLSTVTADRLVRRGLTGTVLRGFTPAELAELGREAGLCDVRVHRHFPFRLVMTARTARQ